MMRLAICLSVLLGSGTASAEVFKLDEMNTAQIGALDRARTAVIMVGGILEEHGPYLPSATDGIGADAVAKELARAIVARPGWNVVLVPHLLRVDHVRRRLASSPRLRAAMSRRRA